jgi:hypothetical protein
MTQAMKRVVAGMRVLKLAMICGFGLLTSCTVCPKIKGFDQLVPQKFEFEDLRFALPGSYSRSNLDPTETTLSGEWRGPEGLMRLQKIAMPADLGEYRREFLSRIQRGYKGLPTRTIPRESMWGETRLDGDQLEVILNPQHLAIDFYYIPHNEVLYIVTFQRAKAKRGEVDPAFLEIERLFWASLCSN